MGHGSRAVTKPAERGSGGRMTEARAAGDPFEALGDANRREILRLLSGGDKPVQEIADAMPISRPAVSRHLRLLKDAGMVAERAQGTRRIYHLQERGIARGPGVPGAGLGRGGRPFPAAGREHRAGRAGPSDRAAADVVRRRLLGRARVHRVDLRDRHVVACRPHRDRPADARRRPAGRRRRADLRAHARRRRARLGRGDGLEPADPAGLPLAPAARPRRRDRGGDPVRRPRRRRRPGSRSSTAAGNGWARAAAHWRDRNRRGLGDPAAALPGRIAPTKGDR